MLLNAIVQRLRNVTMAPVGYFEMGQEGWHISPKIQGSSSFTRVCFWLFYKEKHAVCHTSEEKALFESAGLWASHILLRHFLENEGKCSQGMPVSTPHF